MTKWLLCLIAILLISTYILYPIYSPREIVTIYPDTGPTKLRPEQISDKYEYFNDEKLTLDISNLTTEPEKPLTLNDNDVDDIFNSVSNDINNQTNQDKISDSGLNIVKIEHKFSDNIKTKQKTFYRLQLASVKDKDTAISLWKSYQKKHPEILNNMKLVLKKIEQGNGKFYFLLLTGEYNNIISAKNICNKLLNHKQPCIIFKDY